MERNAGVILNPRTKYYVEVNKKVYVLDLINLHFFPSFRVPGHALNPQVKTAVLNLGPDAESLSNIVQFIRRKSELSFDNSHQVQIFGGRRRQHASLEKLPADMLVVKPSGVPSADNIRFIHESVQVLEHLGFAVVVS